MPIFVAPFGPKKHITQWFFINGLKGVFKQSGSSYHRNYLQRHRLSKLLTKFRINPIWERTHEVVLPMVSNGSNCRERKNRWFMAQNFTNLFTEPYSFIFEKSSKLRNKNESDGIYLASGLFKARNSSSKRRFEREFGGWKNANQPKTQQSSVSQKKVLVKPGISPNRRILRWRDQLNIHSFSSYLFSKGESLEKILSHPDFERVVTAFAKEMGLEKS